MSAFFQISVIYTTTVVYYWSVNEPAIVVMEIAGAPVRRQHVSCTQFNQFHTVVPAVATLSALHELAMLPTLLPAPSSPPRMPSTEQCLIRPDCIKGKGHDGYCKAAAQTKPKPNGKKQKLQWN